MLYNRKELIEGADASLTIRRANGGDLPVIKNLVDQHKRELGFIHRAALQRAIEANSLLISQPTNSVQELAGLVYFYIRQDNRITLYSIVVAPAFRRRGIGRQLFIALQQEARAQGKTEICLKCPAELAANQFYECLGLQKKAIEDGKHRKLNVWVYQSQPEDIEEMQ